VTWQGGARVYVILALASLLTAMLWQEMMFPVAKPEVFPAHFYQSVIGIHDGRACSSYPVCSRYANQAVHQYGLLFGSWLSMDRLIHEADDLQRGPWVFVDGKPRLNDPLKRNAFWLHLR